MEMMAKVTLVREAPQGLLAADATVRMVLMLHLTPQGRVDGAAWDHSAAPWPVTRTPSWTLPRSGVPAELTPIRLSSS